LERAVRRRAALLLSLTPPSLSLKQVDPESLERDNDREIDALGDRVGALRAVSGLGEREREREQRQGCGARARSSLLNPALPSSLSFVRCRTLTAALSLPPPSSLPPPLL